MAAIISFVTSMEYIILIKKLVESMEILLQICVLN